jgi:hypothetical protein
MKNLQSKRAKCFLTRTVLEKFGQKEEIEEYSRLAKGGLFKPEEKLSRKFFQPQAAGLEVVECRSREELEKDIETPERREKDYFIFYVARKAEEGVFSSPREQPPAPSLFTPER